jgi:hypothetical protein
MMPVLTVERFHARLDQLVGATGTMFPHRFEFLVVELVVVHKKSLDVLQRLGTQLIDTFYALPKVEGTNPKSNGNVIPSGW